jgi:hypothetical protein
MPATAERLYISRPTELPQEPAREVGPFSPEDLARLPVEQDHTPSLGRFEPANRIRQRPKVSPISILYDPHGQYVVQDLLGATHGVGATAEEAVADFFLSLDEHLAFLRANQARLHPGLLHQLSQLQRLFRGR